MPDILSSDEIAAMQSEAEIYLPDTGVIKRNSLSSDSMGGFTVSETTIATVSCRVDPPERNIVVTQYAERIGERQLVEIVTPAGTNFIEGDRMYIESVVYEALGVLAGSWELTRNMLCVRQG